MQSTRFISLSIALASLSGCGASEAIPEAEAEAELEPRAIVPVVRPDFEFRFAPGMPSWLDRTAAASSSYSLHQDLPVGPVTITGTVSYDPLTKIAIFAPDADLDARYPYTWEVTGGLADYLEDMPIDIVQAPCVDTDALIDGVPVSDGIPSCREQTGTWYRSQPLAAWGADPAQVDVFIEIDYYNHDDPDLPGATPQWGALERVRQAFLARGYHLHFDVGDLFSSTYIDKGNFNLGGGEPMGFDQGHVPLPANPGNDLEMIALDPTAVCPGGGVPTSSTQNFVSLYRRQHFTNQGRDRSFYYFVFLKEVNGNQAGAQIDGTNGAFPFGHSGWTETFNAQLDGTSISDHLLDVDEPVLDTSCTHQYCNQIVNYQAGTLMHELGHNLGLLHHTGGPGTISSHTPSYWSVMSYQYQTFGVPEDPSTYDGDRFFFANDTKCGNGNHPKTKADLDRGPLSSWMLSDPDHFIIDYSDGHNPCIDESSTTESLGIDGVVNGPSIDWDCDLVDNAGPADLNGDGDTADVLCDNDDWATIDLYHAHWYAQGSWPNDGFPYACPLDTD